MSFKVAFTFLVILCAVQLSTGSLDSLRFQLNTAKSKVESIQRDLKRTRNLLQSSTNSKLSNLLRQSYKNVDNFMSSAISDIGTNAEKAKAEGKDAAAVDKCNNNAKETLRSASTSGYKSLTACKDKASKAAEIHIKKLDAAQTTGDQYIRELNNVFPSCFSSNTIQMQTCVALKLGKINQSIRSYESSIFSIKNDAQRGADSAAISVMSCNFEVESQARVTSTNERIAATKCLKEA